MRRVVIVGSGGAGKSTLARHLGAVTGLPVIHLDREFWRPGWERPAESEFDSRLEHLLAGDAWIIDGNYSRTMARRFAAADTIVLLDPPTVVCMWRAIRRAIPGRERRPDLADGCDERLDLDFIRWVWKFRREQLPKILRRIDALDPGRRVEILRTDADVRTFLSSASKQ